MIPPDQLSVLPFFDGLDAHVLARVAAVADERTAPAGATVMRQYDEAAAVWLLRSGVVQVLMRVGTEDLLVGVLREPGELLGWSAFRPPYRYTASIRCETASEFLVVPVAVFEETFAQDAAVAHEVLRRVAAAVTRRFEHARSLLLTMPRQGPVGEDRP